MLSRVKCPVVRALRSPSLVSSRLGYLFLIIPCGPIVAWLVLLDRLFYPGQKPWSLLMLQTWIGHDWVGHLVLLTCFLEFGMTSREICVPSKGGRLGDWVADRCCHLQPLAATCNILFKVAKAQQQWSSTTVVARCNRWHSYSKTVSQSKHYYIVFRTRPQPLVASFMNAFIHVQVTADLQLIWSSFI